MKTKVLLAAPNSHYKNYCFKEWITLAKSFGVDVFICDNSENDCNKELYKQYHVNYSWVDPQRMRTEDFICRSQNVIREKVLKEGYTHLFFLETDLFPPVSILKLLLSMDLPVVSAPYFIHKGKDRCPMNQEIRMFGKKAFTRNYTLREAFGFQDGTVKQSFSTGFGCSLIKKEVLERLMFRSTPDQWAENSTSGDSHADSFFYADLQRLRIPSYLFTGIVIKHYNSDWSKVALKQKQKTDTL